MDSQDPLKVGTFPMAAFGMLDRDGRQHAHRIYLADDGTGKAEIHHPQTGEELDAKKSMPVREGEASTAGLATIFGATTAAHCILCEGIETAAAIAFAFKDEVKAGAIMVASAINAGGVERFQQWPRTTRIVVAADRDEKAKGRGKKASRRGEQAARCFCLQHHGDEIDLTIAMPGDPGEAVDWLDVLLRDGIEAVREGLENSDPFEPTPAELKAKERADDLRDDNRPMIEIRAGELHKLVDKCAAAIGPSHRVFKRGPMLVHAARVTDPSAHSAERPRGSLIIAPVDADLMRVMLSQEA
ncbi:MAG: toprim domain-containing protein, partial [Alphaproteobacteria bacterium]|nr:toprim domain-containing protein [Alphaproteobacteria bacterium]